MKRKVWKMTDGQWIRPVRRRKDGSWLYKIKCCDCGLVHLVQFQITKSERLRFRAWRLPKKGAKHER